jgi:hypothetical protein
MPPPAAAMSMRQLFNSCQDQSLAEKKLAKCFWQSAATGGAWDELEEILAHILHLEKVRRGAPAASCRPAISNADISSRAAPRARAAPQKTTESERMVRLWGAIARAFPEEPSEEQEELLGEVLRTLGELASDESKAVRFRACQLLAQVINQLPEDLCPMADDDMDALQDQLVERLEDKVAAARAMAAQALKRLTQPNEVRGRAGALWHGAAQPQL